MKELFNYIRVSVIIAICVYLVDFLIGYNATILTWGEQLKNLSIHFLFSFPITLVISEYNNYLSKIYPWETATKKRLWIGGIGNIVLAMITIAIVRFIMKVFLFDISVETYFSTEKLNYYIGSLLITIFITILFHAFYFFKELQKQQITEQKIIAGTASAKFNALKNQLDPHFLFNSLNVLTSLIEENPKMAQKFTTSLSKVYRYVLEQKDKELVTVDEELKFARTYMTLIKLRFEDSIIFDIPDKATNPEARVVPLSLQILLENTVKHNVVTPKRPLHIKIYEKDNFLIVENNLQHKGILQKSTGVGLGNVQQRYALLTKRKFSVYKTEEVFIAELPMLTKQINAPAVSKEDNIEAAKVLKYKRAKEQVKKMRGFYINLTVYCCVIPFLAFQNYNDNGFSFLWVFFPAFGWGLGLLFQSMNAFNYHPILGKDWEKKKIKKYMEASKQHTL